MTRSTRLFRSPWAYLGGVALFLFSLWREIHPDAHPSVAPWHPVYGGIVLTLADVFCIFLAFSFARLTSDALERTALALFTLALLPSIFGDLHTLGFIRTPLPSFRLVFLSINTLLALLAAIRFIQVLRDPALPLVRRAPNTTR